MAVDVSDGLKQDETEALYKYIRKYEVVDIGKYQPLFDVGGGATWNDAIGLMNKSLNFYVAASSIIVGQTAEELRANWLFVANKDVVNIRAEMIAIGAAVTALLDNIGGSVIGVTVDRATGSQVYPALTAERMAEIKTLIDAIDATITTTSDI